MEMTSSLTDSRSWRTSYVTSTSSCHCRQTSVYVLASPVKYTISLLSGFFRANGRVERRASGRSLD